MSKYYKFHQNSSGGVFLDPARIVYVEADSPASANRRAEEVGIYFNGISSWGRDCECCGDRWYEASAWAIAEETEREGLILKYLPNTDDIVFNEDGDAYEVRTEPLRDRECYTLVYKEEGDVRLYIYKCED